MNYLTIFTNKTSTREIKQTQKKEYPGGGVGFTSVVVGKEEVTFNVAIDTGDLMLMADKAARNKSQRCKAGPVLVEVVRRKRL